MLTRTSYRNRQTSALRSQLRVEALEERTLLTTNLFIDFGTRFPAGGLLATAGQVRDAINGPDLTQQIAPGIPALLNNDVLRFSPLSSLVNFDYNRDGAVNGNDVTGLQNTIVNLVSRYYAPFDINVVVAASSNLTEVQNTLLANNASTNGRFDAYVFVANVVNTQTSRPIPAGLFGQAGGQNDLIAGVNLSDNTGIIFANNVRAGLAGFGSSPLALDTALADTASHEAGHTFGLRHTENQDPVAGLLAASDIIAKFASRVASENTVFFSRFDLPRSVAEPFGGFSNAYNQLVNDADIGARAGGPAYVTGTGAFDRITLTRLNATQAAVRVDAFVDPGFTTLVRSAAYTVNTGNGILVEAGFSDDLIVVDATLGTNVRVRGMAGTDRLVVVGNGVTTATYTPGATVTLTADDLPSFRGQITAGTTTINFEEFESTSSVAFTGIANVTMKTAIAAAPNGTDLLALSVPAVGVDAVSGTSNGVAFVPLLAQNVTNLTIDAASNDGTAPNDRLTIQGATAGIKVTFNAGNGTDTIVAPTGTTYTITGTNAGNIAGLVFFSSVENRLTGTTNNTAGAASSIANLPASTGTQSVAGSVQGSASASLAILPQSPRDEQALMTAMTELSRTAEKAASGRKLGGRNAVALSGSRTGMGLTCQKNQPMVYCCCGGCRV